MDTAWLLEKLTILIPLILSLSVHEWAHAYSAFKLGDDTAARMGRMTLNPLSHIDPIGTLIVPLVVAFGWAKPVPINPLNFNRRVRMSTGIVLTAAAGPFSNVVLAIASTIILGIILNVSPALLIEQPGIYQFIKMMIQLNVILAIFNMLPIPPLDGSRVADGLMPRALRPAWEKFSEYGTMALIAVLVMPYLFGFSILGWPVGMVHEGLRYLLDQIV